VIIDEYLPKYEAQGFQPIIVHVGDALGFGCDLSRTYGEDLPLLLDSDNTLLNIFQQVGLNSVLFPLAYLIEENNVVTHVYNDPDDQDEETESPNSLITDLEGLLTGP